MYTANERRCDSLHYNCPVKSGLQLGAVSLGQWHNFGETGCYDNMRRICLRSLDNGVIHFDLANNYGPPEGAAEQILDSIRAAKNTTFTADERKYIDKLCRIAEA